MNVSYEIVGELVVKKYEDGQIEELCLVKDVDVIISRTRETIDRMEAKLSQFIESNENSALSLMFQEYVIELNELKRISLMK